MPVKKDEKFELLESFHQQFSENQNHHQTIFIQFISAVLVVLVGYGYVLTNTDSHAQILETCKNSAGVIESYSMLDLIGSYLIAQTILSLLVTLTANIGYSFRRDQMVIVNIRRQYLTEADYKSIFPQKSYDPTRNNWRNFLPEFNRMFIYALAIIQVFLMWSVFSVLSSLLVFTLWAHPVYDFLIISPIIWAVYVYFLYYKKYKFICHPLKKK